MKMSMFGGRGRREEEEEEEERVEAEQVQRVDSLSDHLPFVDQRTVISPSGPIPVLCLSLTSTTPQPQPVPAFVAY